MGQLQTKFIEDNAVKGTKIRLDNNEVFRARRADNAADVSLFKLSSANEFVMLTQPQADASLPLPSAAKHYVTVEWAENFFAGKQDPKEAVFVYADTNIPLSGSTPLVIDGLTITDQYEIGLGGQTDPIENGPYVATVTGGTYTLARRNDFDTDSEVSKGAYFPVVGGTNYAGYTIILTTDDPITIDTTPLTFVAYPTAISIIGGDMITKTGNTLSVDLASLSGLESTNPGNVGGQLRVKVDTASLEKDKTTRVDSVSGALVTKKSRIKSVTLNSTDITNQYIDLDYIAEQDSVDLCPVGAGHQQPGVDFTVNYTGGTGGNTRVTFAGGLATGGVSALVSGDKVDILYRSF